MSSIDDHVRSALDRVLVSLTSKLEADLSASSSDILRAVTEASDRAAADAAEHAAAEVRRQSDEHLSVVRAELERERDEQQRGAAVEMTELRRVVEQTREQLHAATLAVESERHARESAERRLEDSRREGGESRQAAEEAAGRVEAISRELDTARGKSGERQRENDELRRQLEEARHRIEAAEREMERSSEQTDSLRRELEAAREAVAHADRLASGLRVLDAAASLGDVLDSLCRLAGEEAGRAAVFLVLSGGLRGWRTAGFDASDSIVGTSLRLDQAGLIGEAARLASRRQHEDDHDQALPTFASGAGQRWAAALPVEVGGLVMAVLYADAAQADTVREPRWLANLDLLVRHAGRVLEAVTVRQAAALWAPRSAETMSRDHGVSNEEAR